MLKKDPVPGEFDDLDIEKILKEIAQKYYAKFFCSYEDVFIIKNGVKIKWKYLTIKEKFKELKEGSRGKDIQDIEKKEQEYQKFIKNNKNEKEAYNFTDPIFKKFIGAGKEIYSTGHGPKHCVRACFLAESVSRVYKNLYKEFEKMSEEEIKLASIAAIFHDSGRQGDYVDVFDGISGQNAYNYLKKRGIVEHHCQRVKSAIENKDANIKNKDKIAIALHEADCLEYQRIYERVFEPKYLDSVSNTSNQSNSALTPIKGIKIEEIKNKIDTLVKNSKKLIELTGNKEENPKNLNFIELFKKIYNASISLNIIGPGSMFFKRMCS